MAENRGESFFLTFIQKFREEGDSTLIPQEHIMKTDELFPQVHGRLFPYRCLLQKNVMDKTHTRNIILRIVRTIWLCMYCVVQACDVYTKLKVNVFTLSFM